MDVSYKAFCPDGIMYPMVSGDMFGNLFDSPEEVRDALEKWAVQRHMEGTPYAICRVSHEKKYDESGQWIRTEDVTEVVEHYTPSGKYNDPFKESQK